MEMVTRSHMMHETTPSSFPLLDSPRRPFVRRVDVWKPKMSPARRVNHESWDIKNGINHCLDRALNLHKRENRSSRLSKPSSEHQRRCSIGIVSRRHRDGSVDNSTEGRVDSNNPYRHQVNGSTHGSQQSQGSEGQKRFSTAGSVHFKLSSEQKTDANTVRLQANYVAEKSKITGQQQQQQQQRTGTEGEIRKLKPMKLQFWRTKMCPWVTTLGNCRKGASCRYAHTQDELRPLPDLTKTKMCDDFIKIGQCLNREACKYAHSVEELRATTSFSKTKICPLWLQGSCTAGPDCRFAHGEQELRNTILPLLDDFTNSSRDGRRSGGESGCRQSRRESFSPSRESDEYNDNQRNTEYLADHMDQYSDEPQQLSCHNVELNQNIFPVSYDTMTYQDVMPLEDKQSFDQGVAQNTTGLYNVCQHPQQGPNSGVPSIVGTPPREKGHWTYPFQQVQQSVVDPTVLLQGLSPMSMRVATNALVYLSELQHMWPPTIGNLQSCPTTINIPSTQTNDHQSSQLSPPIVKQVASDSASITHHISQSQPQQYTHMVYPQSPTARSAALWNNGSSNVGQILPQSIGGRSPILAHPVNSSPHQHIVGGTPLRYFNSRVTFPSATTTPMSRPPGFSPMSQTASGEPSGMESGRFVTTHLLPSGMFSPITQESFRPPFTSHIDHQQQRKTSSPQPSDHLLSFPTTTPKVMEQITGPDGNSSTTNPPSGCCRDGGMCYGPSSLQQQQQFSSYPTLPRQHHKDTIGNLTSESHNMTIPSPNAQQLLTWNPKTCTSQTQPVAPTSYIIPIDPLHQQQSKQNKNQSPNIFLTSASHATTSSLFPSPLLSNHTQSTVHQTGSISNTCMSPASYTTAVSFPNGVASPTTAILATLNLLPGPQPQANSGVAESSGIPYRSSELDVPVIPGFPLLTFLASQPVQSEIPRPTAANLRSQFRPVLVNTDFMNKDIVGSVTASQFECFQKTLSTSQSLSEHQSNCTLYPQQHVQHCTPSLFEHSPSLFSSKSSSERTSTGSPATTAATTAPHPKPFAEEDV